VSPQLDGLIDLGDAERLARERLPSATYEFIAAGAGDGRAVAANRAAFARRTVIPRVLAAIDRVQTGIELLGRRLALPVLVPPMGMQRIVDPEGEVAMARGVHAAGTVMCVSAVASRSAAEVAATGVPSWLQLYLMRDPALNAHLLAQARAAGCEAVVLTVDGPVTGRRNRALRAGYTLPPDVTVPAFAGVVGDGPDGPAPAVVDELLASDIGWSALEALVAQAGLPVIVKGILAPADAARACELGAAGVIVSNHGGRQLDAAVASLDALPAVVDAVAGRIPVLLDGGVRSGTDVVIALANGAAAVLVGRPLYWSLAAGGSDGVAAALELLRAEIAQALLLCGCPSPGAAGPALLGPTY
jgi:4-hydroxymandelate oxidase